MATGTALQPQKKSKHSHYLLAGVNQFAPIRTFVVSDFKNVVRISVNSPWSHGFLDLDQEPMVVSTPDMDARYIVAQELNMWAYDFTSAGTRMNGGTAANYLISGPKWNGPIPKDVDESVKFTTRYAWVLVQMAAASPADFPAIHAKQDQLKITPLGASGKPHTPPATVPVNPNLDFPVTPLGPLDARRGVFESASTHAGRQSPLHSIQRGEDAVFHSSERLFQPPLERADAGPPPWI